MSAERPDVTWHDRAACRNDPRDWVEPSDVELPSMLAVCDRCPVTEVCAGYGLATKSTGVWGGRLLHIGKSRTKAKAS